MTASRSKGLIYGEEGDLAAFLACARMTGQEFFSVFKPEDWSVTTVTVPTTQTQYAVFRMAVDRWDRALSVAWDSLTELSQSDHPGDENTENTERRFPSLQCEFIHLEPDMTYVERTEFAEHWLNYQVSDATEGFATLPWQSMTKEKKDGSD